MKSITEISDLAHSNAIHLNNEHESALKAEGPKTFARKDGIFTHLYISAARIKEDKPFKV